MKPLHRWTAGLLLAIALLAQPAWAGNDQAITATLTSLKGKRATLKLASGQELTGIVGVVADGAVTLTELTGMEFFDAVVRVERVDAVVMRRAPQ